MTKRTRMSARIASDENSGARTILCNAGDFIGAASWSTVD
jgi:hypothetical protein